MNVKHILFAFIALCFVCIAEAQNKNFVVTSTEFEGEGSFKEVLNSAYQYTENAKDESITATITFDLQSNSDRTITITNGINEVAVYALGRNITIDGGDKKITFKNEGFGGSLFKIVDTNVSMLNIYAIGFTNVLYAFEKTDIEVRNCVFDGKQTKDNWQKKVIKDYSDNERSAISMGYYGTITYMADCEILNYNIGIAYPGHVEKMERCKFSNIFQCAIHSTDKGEFEKCEFISCGTGAVCSGDIIRNCSFTGCVYGVVYKSVKEFESGFCENSAFTNCDTSIYMDDNIVKTITDCKFKSTNVGIYQTAGTIKSIERCVFSENTLNGIIQRKGIIDSVISSSFIETDFAIEYVNIHSIENSSFKGNILSVSGNTSTTKIVENTFEENVSDCIISENGDPGTYSKNLFYNNNGKAIRQLGGYAVPVITEVIPSENSYIVKGTSKTKEVELFLSTGDQTAVKYLATTQVFDDKFEAKIDNIADVENEFCIVACGIETELGATFCKKEETPEYYVRTNGNGKGSSWDDALSPEAFYDLITTTSKPKLVFYIEEGSYDLYKLSSKSLDYLDGEEYQVKTSATIYGGYNLTNDLNPKNATGITEFGSSFTQIFDKNITEQKTILTFEHGLNASRCAFKNMQVTIQNGDVDISNCSFYKSIDVDKFPYKFIETYTTGNVELTNCNFFYENRNSEYVCAGAVGVTDAKSFKIKGCTFHSILAYTGLVSAYNVGYEEYSNNTIFECSVKNFLFSVGDAHFYSNTFLNNDINKNLIYGNDLSLVGNIIFDNSNSDIKSKSTSHKNNLVSSSYEEILKGEKIIREEDVLSIFDYNNQDGNTKLSIKNDDNLQTIELMDDHLVDGTSIRVSLSDIEVGYDQRGHKRLANTCVGSLEKDIEYYVKISGSGDGSSWETAMSDSMFLSILPKAYSGTTFHVAEGSYIHEGNKNPYAITSDVKIIGGYPDSAKTGCLSKPELYHSVFETVPGPYGYTQSNPTFFQISKDISVELHNIDFSHAGILSNAHKLVIDSCNFYEGWHNLQGSMDSLHIRNSYFAKMFKGAKLTSTGEHHISCNTGFASIDRCTFEGCDDVQMMTLELKGIKDKSCITNCTFFNLAQYTIYPHIYIDSSEPIFFVNNTIVGNNEGAGLIEEAKVFYFKDAIFEGNIFAGVESNAIENKTLKNRNNLVGFESNGEGNKSMSIDDIASIFECTYKDGAFIPKLSYNDGYTPTVKVINDKLLNGTSIRFPLDETIVETDQRGVARYNSTCPGAYEKDPSEIIKLEYYVKQYGEGDGKSWESAMDGYTFLSMLSNAIKGSTFYVAEGSYVNSGGMGPNVINTDVKIIGGYPDNAVTGSISQPENYHTVFETVSGPFGLAESDLTCFSIAQGASVEIHNVDFQQTGIRSSAHKLVIDSCNFYDGYHCVEGMLMDTLEVRNSYFAKMVQGGKESTNGNFHITCPYSKHVNIEKCTFEGSDNTEQEMINLLLVQDKSYVQNCTFYNLANSSEYNQLTLFGADTIHFYNNTIIGNNSYKGLINNENALGFRNVIFVGNIFAGTDNIGIEENTIENKYNVIGFESKGVGNKTITLNDLPYFYEGTYSNGVFYPTLSKNNGGYAPTVKLVREKFLDGTSIRFPLDETFVTTDQRGQTRYELTCPGSYEKDPSESDAPLEYYVKIAGSGDGSSWETAMSDSMFLSILPNAIKGSTFHVAEGTYTHNGGQYAYAINSDITIIGGYPDSAKTGCLSKPELYHSVFETVPGPYGYGQSSPTFFQLSKGISVELHNIDFSHAGILSNAHKLVIDSCKFYEGWHNLQGSIDSLYIRNSFFAKMFKDAKLTSTGEYHITCNTGFASIDRCTFEGCSYGDRMILSLKNIKTKSYIKNCSFYNLPKYTLFNQIYIEGTDTVFFVNNTIVGNDGEPGLLDDAKVFYFKNVVFDGNIFAGVEKDAIENKTLRNRNNLLGFESEGTSNSNITAKDLILLFDGKKEDDVFVPTLFEDESCYVPIIKLIGDTLSDGSSIRFPLSETIVDIDQRGKKRNESTCPGAFEYLVSSKEVNIIVKDTVCGLDTYSKYGFNIDLTQLEVGVHEFTRSDTTVHKVTHYELSLTILQPMTSLKVFAQGTDQQCYGVDNGSIQVAIKTNLPYDQVKVEIVNTEAGELVTGVFNANNLYEVKDLAPSQYAIKVRPLFEGCAVEEPTQFDTTITISKIESVLAIDDDYLIVKNSTCHNKPNGTMEIRVGNWSTHYTASVYENDIKIEDKNINEPEILVTADGYAYLKSYGRQGNVKIIVSDICNNNDTIATDLKSVQEPSIAIIDSHKRLRCSYSKDGYFTYEIKGGNPATYLLELSGEDMVAKSYEYKDTIKVDGLTSDVYTMKYYSTEDGCADAVSVNDTVQAPLPMEFVKAVSPLICNDEPSGEFSLVPHRKGTDAVYKYIKNSKNYAVEFLNEDSTALNVAFPEVRSVKISSPDLTDDSLKVAFRNSLIMNENDPETLTPKYYPLRALWKDSFGDTIPVAWIGFDELPGAIYNVTVVDTSGCEFTDEIAITKNPTYNTLTFDKVKFDPEAAACRAEERRVEINVSGGWGKYSYSIARIEDMGNLNEELDSLQNNDNENVDTSALIEGNDMAEDSTYESVGKGYYRSAILDKGHYLITITDSMGCFKLYKDTIEVKSNISVDGTVLIDKCDPSAANKVEVVTTVSDGYNTVGPYTYKVKYDSVKYEKVTDGLSFIADSLPNGTVGIYVTDGNNCGAYRTFTLKRNDSIDILTVRHIADYPTKCYNEPTGAVSFKLFGGKPDYTYFILDNDTLSHEDDIMVMLDENEQLTNTYYALQDIDFSDSLAPKEFCMTNIGAGNHKLKVVDENGCSASIKFTTTEPEMLNVTAEASKVCPNDSKGRIYPQKVSGGIKPYTYAIGIDTPKDAFSTEDHISAEANKPYSLFVQDKNGCVAKSEKVTVSGSFEAEKLDPNCLLATWHNIGDILVAIDATNYNGLGASAKLDSTVIELTNLPDSVIYEVMPKELYLYGVPDPDTLNAVSYVTWYGDTISTPCWGIPTDIASGVKTQAEYEKIRTKIEAQKKTAKEKLLTNSSYADTLAMLHRLECMNSTLDMIRDSFVQLVPNAEAEKYYFIRISNLKDLGELNSFPYSIKMTQYISGCSIVTELNDLNVVVEGTSPYKNLLQHDILGISCAPNPVTYDGTANIEVTLGNKVDFTYTVYDFSGKKIQEGGKFKASDLEESAKEYKASFEISNITTACLVTVRTDADAASVIVLVGGK